MSFYPPEQRCPRCRYPVAQGEPACPNCGLTRSSAGNAPRASRSGPPPSWQPDGSDLYGAPPAGGRFGNPGSSGPVVYRPSGPAMYRPGGQPARGGSGPWADDSGASFQRPASGYQRQPGASGDFSSYRDRSTGYDDASTGYPGPASGQRGTSGGWGTSAGGQGSSFGQRSTPAGLDSSAGYQSPFSGSRDTASAWGNPAGYQRPPPGYRGRPSGYQGSSSGYRGTPTGWGGSTSYQDAPLDYWETPADLYDDEAAPAYGRSQAFRGAPGQSWQQSYASAPTAYPGYQQGYGGYYAPPDPALGPPMQPPPRQGKKVAVILLAVLVILGAVGGAAYLFIRAQPVIGVTSKYAVGATPAGSATTTLHLTGSQFSAHSVVNFLLDGQPEPGHQTIQSDASGAIKGDLTITPDWPLGQHDLTAKDASGSATILGKTIMIVAQGEAGTPGPKGAPADNTRSFIINLTVHQHDPNSGQDSTYPYSLVVTGQPDPAGGTVCNPGQDTGQPKTENDTTSDGVKFTATWTAQCSGGYKGGKITYTQTYSDVKLAYSNGVTCTAPPFVNQELDGSFTSATALSGTLSSGSATFTCSNGRTATAQGVTGTWTGSLSA